MRLARPGCCALLAALALGACRPGSVMAPGADGAVVDPLGAMLAEGDRLRREGQDDAALQRYERAIAQDRAAVPAHRRYVATLLALGRRSEARARYRERVTGSDVTHVEEVMARRLETNGTSSALRRVYALAARTEPESPWWHLALVEIEVGEAAAWNERRQEAIDRGDRREERKAFAQAHEALVRAAAHLEEADLLAQAAPRRGTRAEVDLWRGLLRSVEGDVHAGAAARQASWRAAEDAFARATRRDPLLVEAWEGLGDARLRLDDVRGSLEAFREAATLSPADPRLREAIGVALMRADRPQEAAEQLRQAADLAPRESGALLRLGDAWAQGERWDAALLAWDEALRRDPDAVEAHVRIASVLEHQGRLGEARAAYERYVDQGGARAGVVRRRIERMLRQERTGACPSCGEASCVH